MISDKEWSYTLHYKGLNMVYIPLHNSYKKTQISNLELSLNKYG